MSIEQPRSDIALNLFLDRVHDGFFVLDNHCRFTTLNRKAAELAPRRPEALLGKQIWTAFPGTVGSIVWREFRRAMNEGVPVCFPYYSSCLGRCYEVNAYPSEEGLTVFFHDVTDERSACEAREALERGIAFRAEVAGVLSNVDAPLDTVLQGCAEAVVRHTDAAFARIWLLNQSEKMLVLHASAGMYTHLDGPYSRIPVGSLEVGRIAASRRPHLTNSVQVDSFIDDREWARREKIISFAGHPLMLGDEVIGVMAIFARHQLSKSLLNDFSSVASAITEGIERKRTEKALRDSEETLRLAAEVTELGTWDWDLPANILTLNTRTRIIFGLPSQGEPSFEAFISMIHPDDRERVREAIARAMNPESLGDYDIEYRVIIHGTLKWVKEKGLVTFKGQRPNRVPIRFIGTVIDITEAKKTEEDLREANRAKDEFLAVLSHELRTPLTAIYGWATLLRGGKLNNEKAVRAYEVIERNVKAQLQLVDDLLNVSRIILGKVKIAPKWLEPTSVVDAAAESIRPAAATKGISVYVQGNGPDLIFGDPDRLQQVIYNLLTNALKFTNSGGEIRVEFGRIGNEYHISVRDTGEGISPDFLPFVFDRFRQADASITRKHGGLGLGLNIVRTIVEMHAGTVTANSAGKGKGTTMTIRLPLPAQQEVEKLQPRNKAEFLNGVTVMVVDDEEDTRYMLGEAVQQYGASVILASSAAEALNELNRRKPDVLISDVGMPDMDGYQLIRTIRSELSPDFQNLPAVALSAFASADDRQKALQAGYRAHIAKPVAVQDLVSVVAGLANGRHGA